MDGQEKSLRTQLALEPAAQTRPAFLKRVAGLAAQAFRRA